MTANRAGEDHALEVAAFADQVVNIVAMGDARHVLIDDGPLIELRGGVVHSRADELHSAFVGLVVRLLTHERRQEGVVDGIPNCVVTGSRSR